MKKAANISNGTGRRKTAVARVHMRKGSGKIQVNGKEMEKYFALPLQQAIIRSPGKICAIESTHDFIVTVRGGGLEGQAVAIRHGISRALVKLDADNRPPLKEPGFLTRDPRRRERKKYGRPGARKSFQFSKR